MKIQWIAMMLTASVLFGNAGAEISRAAAMDQDPPRWRSTLYPADWLPGYADEESRFLHDFSYAGYAMGERPLPGRDRPATVFIEARDGDSNQDDTERIQAALTEVGEHGGGVVELGHGIFRIAPGEGQSAALVIRHSKVVLRGQGPESTLLINTEPVMRRRHVILVAPENGTGRVWHRQRGDATPLAEDASNQSMQIHLEAPADFEPGDWIVARQDATEAFIADHDMTGLWSERLGGLAFYRQITSVDDAGRLLTLDIPLRQPLLVRDGARVYRTAPHLEEVGIEDVAIGMLEHSGEGFGASDYRTEGTAAYEVHYAHVLTMSHIVNGWIRGVHTVRPAENTRNIHMVSNGILLRMSRNVTIADCIIARPQYRGRGGNGYGITLAGSDCLVTNTQVTHGRHNFSFKSLWTTGNVIHACRAEHGMLSSDFHMHLSAANLFDQVTVNRDWLEARYRPYGTIIHGHPTTESVFWNTHGEAGHPRKGNTIIDSRQFGWGYIIGTRGRAHGVRTRPTRVAGSGSVPARETTPEDFVEGIGEGESLVPQSLYLDQLARRLEQAE